VSRSSLSGKVSAFAAAWLAGCVPIRAANQEIRLRHDADHDTLEALILYDGIQAEPQSGFFGSDDGVRRGLEFIQNALARRREFVLFGWLDLDLEKPFPELSPEEAEDWGKFKEEATQCSSLVSVASSGLLRGPDGRLGLFQEVRIREVSRLVHLANLGIWSWIDEAVRRSWFDESSMHDVDASTRRMWADLARERRPVLTLDARGFAIEFPMSASSATRMLAEASRDASKDPGFARSLASFLSSLSELRIEGDRVRMQWRWPLTPISLPMQEDVSFEDKLALSIPVSDRDPIRVQLRDAVVARFENR